MVTVQEDVIPAISSKSQILDPAGTLPPKWGELESLRVLKLGTNDLTGRQAPSLDSKMHSQTCKLLLLYMLKSSPARGHLS